MDALDLVAKIKMDLAEYEEGLDKASKDASKAGSGIGGAFGKVAKVGGKALVGLTKATAVAVGAAATGVGALVTKSVKAYADYEQMVGGVQKLYGNMGMSLEDYAASVGKTTEEVAGEWQNLEKAQNLVMQNAKNAYKTAGMSANQYMETATSFSASLIDSLGGDTVKAAEQTDVAMRAISDNFNTFGGDISMIQGAFQGFAKQNYTMLDNLKLGYGGTKEEMQRLIDDANAYAEANGQAANLSIKSFSDIVTAIDLVQQKQNIAGTTAREATTTIAGSLGMVGAAWENLVTGLSDKNADVGKLINNLMDTIVGGVEVGSDGVRHHVNGFIDNILPVVEKAIESVGTLINKLIPKLLALIPTLINDALPQIVTAAATLIEGLANAISNNMDSITRVITIIVNAIVGMLPQLLTIGIQIIGAIADAITSNLDTIVSAAVEIILQLSMALLEALPTILEIGLQVIIKLMEGITEALPEMIPTIVDIVLQIVDVLIDNLPLLVDASTQLIIGLAQGLIRALPQLAQKAPEIVTSLANAVVKSVHTLGNAALTLIKTLGEGLIRNLPMLISCGVKLVKAVQQGIQNVQKAIYEAGVNLLTGLWNGIVSKKDWLITQVKSIGSSIINAVKGVFRESSPSKVFYDIGENLGIGLGMGWDDSMEDVNKQIDKDLNYKGSIDMSVKTGLVNTTSSVATGEKALSDMDIDRILGALSINLYNTTEIDGTEIKKDSYKYTVTRLGDETRAVKIAMGGY